MPATGPRWAFGLLALVGLTGSNLPACGSRDAAPPSSEEPSTVPDTAGATPGDAAPAMVHVRGVVRLAADLDDLPGYELADIGREPGRPGVPDACSPARASDLRPLSLSSARGVGGLLVTATGDPARFRALPEGEPRSIPLDIRDCRLEPTLVVTAVGDTLELTNRSPVAFITSFTTDPINEALAPNRVRQLEIIRPGVQQVGCSLVAGCGRTDVVVLAHRVATVTNAEGAFELDVPAGAEVVLHAWHPLLGRREGEARLTAEQAVAGQTHSVDIELRLTPAAPNPVVAPLPAAGGVDLH